MHWLAHFHAACSKHTMSSGNNLSAYIHSSSVVSRSQLSANCFAFSRDRLYVSLLMPLMTSEDHPAHEYADEKSKTQKRLSSTHPHSAKAKLRMYKTKLRIHALLALWQTTTLFKSLLRIFESGTVSVTEWCTRIDVLAAHLQFLSPSRAEKTTKKTCAMVS